MVVIYMLCACIHLDGLWFFVFAQLNIFHIIITHAHILGHSISVQPCNALNLLVLRGMKEQFWTVELLLNREQNTSFFL